MRKFAKIFGPDTNQVLVMRDTDDDCEVIRVFFQPSNPDFGLCHATRRFGRTDAAAMQADCIFDAMDEAAAEKIIADARKVTA